MKITLKITHEGQTTIEEVEGTFYFTSGMDKPEDRDFQISASDKSGNQYTIDIPLDFILEEIKTVMKNP